MRARDFLDGENLKGIFESLSWNISPFLYVLSVFQEEGDTRDPAFFFFGAKIIYEQRNH